MEIKIESMRPFRKEGKLKAFFDLTFDGVFIIKGLKIVEGSKGLFVSMPRQKNSKEVWDDICHPITKEFKDKLEELAISAYKAL